MLMHTCWKSHYRKKKTSADDSEVLNCEEGLWTLMGKTFLSLRKGFSYKWKCTQVRDRWKMSKSLLNSNLCSCILTQKFVFIFTLTEFLHKLPLYLYIRALQSSQKGLYSSSICSTSFQISDQIKAAGTREHKPNVSIIINEGTYWVNFSSGALRVEHKQDRGCVSAFILWRGVFAGCGKGVCPNFSRHKKSRGWWLRWFFSSRGKPRSQWVWPTAAHLEPMRLGEDLWREEEKLSQRGTPQRAKHHPSSRVSPRCSWVVYKPTRSAFSLTLNFFPRHHQVENQYSERGFTLIRSTSEIFFSAWHHLDQLWKSEASVFVFHIPQRLNTRWSTTLP